MIPPVVASDRGRAQTTDVSLHQWGCRTTILYLDGEERCLESHTIEGESPVSEAREGIV